MQYRGNAPECGSGFISERRISRISWRRWKKHTVVTWLMWAASDRLPLATIRRSRTTVRLDDAGVRDDYRVRSALLRGDDGVRRAIMSSVFDELRRSRLLAINAPTGDRQSAICSAPRVEPTMLGPRGCKHKRAQKDHTHR